MAAVRAMTEPIPKPAFDVLLYYAECSRSERPERGAWPSYAIIAQAMHVSRRSIERYVPWLEERGYLRFIRNVRTGPKSWTRAYTVCVEGNVKEVPSPRISLEAEGPATAWRVDNEEGPASQRSKDSPNRLKDPPQLGVQVPSRVPTKDSSNTAISPCGESENQTQLQKPNPKLSQLEGNGKIPKIKGKTMPKEVTNEEWERKWRSIQTLKVMPSGATVGMYRGECGQCGGAIGYCGH